MKTKIPPCKCGGLDYLVPYTESAHVRMSAGGTELLEHEDGHEYEGRELDLAHSFCKQCGTGADLSAFSVKEA